MPFTVSTDGEDPPGPATLVSPSGTITEDMPTYTWNAVETSTWYYLWVEDGSGNTFKKWYTAESAGCPAGTGNCSVTPALALPDGDCQWRIQTWNSYGYGPWSTVMLFTVDTQPDNEASGRFYNNLLCYGSSFNATLTVGGKTLSSTSGNWSSCKTWTPGTHSWSLYANAGACGTITASGSIYLDPDTIYDVVLDLDGTNIIVWYLERTGDCSTSPPWVADVSGETLMEIPFEIEGFTREQ
jgi:hypothetical protein